MAPAELFWQLDEAKAKIFELEFHLANLDAKVKQNEDIIQDLRKELQRAKDFEKIASSAIEALSAKR